MSVRVRVLLGMAAVAATVVTTVAVTSPASTGVAGAAEQPVGAQRWVARERGAWFHWSSPAVADVNGDGRNEVIVGGLGGRLFAYEADGKALPGWGGVVASAAVASSPAVGDLDGDGRPEIAVGVGTLEVANQRGALDIFRADGTRRCSIQTRDARTPPHTEGDGVFAAPAIGDVDGDGRDDVVFGSFDHRIRVVDANCTLMGIFENRDSVWSSPALRDIDGDGRVEIFIGGDATRNPANGESIDGGYFRSLRWQPGYAGPHGSQNLAVRWERSARESFQGSAAIGDLNGDGRLEVVTGTGGFYCRMRSQCADSAKVWAFHLDDGTDVPGWPRTTSMETTFLAAPALGDIDGDGRLDVVVNTNQYDQAAAGKAPNGGAIDVFYGDPAKPRRSYVTPDVELTAAPVIADVTGGGTPEVVVAGASQVTVLGPSLEVVQKEIAMNPPTNNKSAVAVGQLGGTWALVVAGFDGAKDGVVQVHDIATPTSTPWPMHRRNARRTGVDSVLAAPPRSGFFDVPDSSVYSPSVKWAADRAITGGCSATLFCPGRPVTRAQAATFLWRFAGEPATSGAQFRDVDPAGYYATAARWVREKAITAGCTDTEFCPNGSATRAQLVTFLWRAAGSPDRGRGHGFADVPPGVYYEQAVTWAVGKKITTGTEPGRFSPNLAVNRGQTVTFLERAAPELAGL